MATFAPSDNAIDRFRMRLARRKLFTAGAALASSAWLTGLAHKNAPVASAYGVTRHIDGPLSFEQLGKQGAPILFVHPATTDHSSFLYQMAQLSTRFRTVAMDLPGWGSSPAALPGLTTADLAEACWSVVDTAIGAGQPAILCGFSMGSTIALQMAAMHPDRTLAIVLTGAGSTLEGFGGQKSETVADAREDRELHYEHKFVDFSPEFAETDVSRWMATLLTQRSWTDMASIERVFEAVESARPGELYAAIRSPMLFIEGSKDEAFAGSSILAAKVQGAEHAAMEGAGHACNLERPWEWEAHFLTFLVRRGLFDG